MATLTGHLHMLRSDLRHRDTLKMGLCKHLTGFCRQHCSRNPSIHQQLLRCAARLMHLNTLYRCLYVLSSSSQREGSLAAF